jgi:RimJ/RimL family protein N-acetyltransferase
MNYANIRAIEFDDIQLLRYWRNLDHVRVRMEMSNSIEVEEQRRWFERINADTSKHFIYSLGVRDIGSININNINYDEKSFMGGIFCGDSSFLNHWINVWACIKIYNHAFNDLDLKTAFATIIKDNKVAISLNKSLGYIYTKDKENDIGIYVLSKEEYFKSTNKIQIYLRNFLKQNL